MGLFKKKSPWTVMEKQHAPYDKFVLLSDGVRIWIGMFHYQEGFERHKYPNYPGSWLVLDGAGGLIWVSGQEEPPYWMPLALLPPKIEIPEFKVLTEGERIYEHMMKYTKWANEKRNCK